MKLLDWIIVGVMFAMIILAGFYYFNRNIQECTRNPLVFASQLYEEEYPVRAYGTMTLIPTEFGKKSITINFDANNYSIKN